MRMSRTILFDGLSKISGVSGKDSANQKFIYIFIRDYTQHFAVEEGSLMPLRLLYSNTLNFNLEAGMKTGDVNCSCPLIS